MNLCRKKLVDLIFVVFFIPNDIGVIALVQIVGEINVHACAHYNVLCNHFVYLFQDPQQQQLMCLC